MNENLVKECEQIMLSEFSEMHEQIKLLHEEQTNLFDALRQLEEANLEAGASGIHSNLGRGKYSGTCSNALKCFHLFTLSCSNCIGFLCVFGLTLMNKEGKQRLMVSQKEQ
ncbi:hypothetical protein Bca4012_056655 [Brassica carinata]